MPIAQRVEITVPPGVNKDDTSYTAIQYTDADKIRFYKSYPQKIGGWQWIPGNDTPLPYVFDGIPRSMYSFKNSSGVDTLIIGTSGSLYALVGPNMYDITPISSTTTPATGLSSNYDTLGSNPVYTTIGTSQVGIKVGLNIATYQVGDIITISGFSSPVGGIPFASINQAEAIISDIDSINGIIYYRSGGNTPATSTVTGGGGTGGIIGTNIITVNVASTTGLVAGQRVAIAGATGFNAFSSGNLNVQGFIRYIQSGSFAYAIQDVVFSTSSSSGGGAGVTYATQITAGVCDFQDPYGYGGGNYGDGNYGEPAKMNADGIQILPTIWSFDRYNDAVIMTPGNQSAVYTWDGNIANAPVLLSGTSGASHVPTYVNYVFVANDQVILFGPTADASDSAPNKFICSVKGTVNTFSDLSSPSTVSSVVITVADIDRLLANAFVKNKVVLFSSTQVKQMIWNSYENTWNVTDVLLSDGILGPKSQTSLNDAVVFVGQRNWYVYNGSIVSAIPNNTLRQWFYENLNAEFAFKCFFAKNINFNELWFFYPSVESPDNECDSYIIWNYEEGHFTNGKLHRTAAEDVSDVTDIQFLADGSCSDSVNYPNILYRHEVADDYSDAGNPMTGLLVTNQVTISDGLYVQQIERIIPSNILLPLNDTAPQTNVVLYNLTVFTKDYDQQPSFRTFVANNITNNTQKIEIRAQGRQWGYQFNFNNTVGFRIEKFFAELKPLTVR